MPRLPQPGSDEGQWGTILNDFLSVEHYLNPGNTSDPDNGKLKIKIDGTLANKVNTTDARLSNPRTPVDNSVTTQKLADGAVTAVKVSGIPTLDVDGKIPISQIPDIVSVSGVNDSIATRQLYSEKGLANGYAGLDSSGKVPSSQLPPAYAARPVLVSLSVPGSLAVGAGTARFYVPTAGIIQSIEATLGVPPNEASVIIDVNKNGSSMFAASIDQPAILPAAYTSGMKVPDVATFSSGDYLTVDIDQIGHAPAGGGSWSPGSGLTVIIRYIEA